MVRTNIKDIAKAAGVSTATVSYALNGGTGVSEATRKKIQKIARTMNYTPFLSAQILVRQSSQLVCALVDSYETDTNNDLLQILEEQFQKAGYQMLTTSQVLPELQQSDLFSGIIVLDLGLTNKRRQQILALNRPTIFLAGATAEQSMSIMTDNAGGMQLIFAEMQRSVHQRVCVIAGRKASYNNTQRLTALRELFATQRPDINFDEIVYPGYFSSQKAYQLGQKLMDQYDAFICLNDAMAFGIYRAAFERGLTVGQDLSVTGFDDVLMGAFALPGLTTVGFNHQKWAQAVVDQYLQLQNEEVTTTIHQLIPAELISRGSVRQS